MAAARAQEGQGETGETGERETDRERETGETGRDTHGLMPWMAGSVCAHAQYASSLPGSQLGLVSQCVPELHHGGPQAAAEGPPAQHFEFAGAVPLQVPPLSLQLPMNQKIPGTTQRDCPAGSSAPRRLISLV